MHGWPSFIFSPCLISASKWSVFLSRSGGPIVNGTSNELSWDNDFKKKWVKLFRDSLLWLFFMLNYIASKLAYYETASCKIWGFSFAKFFGQFHFLVVLQSSWIKQELSVKKKKKRKEIDNNKCLLFYLFYFIYWLLHSILFPAVCESGGAGRAERSVPWEASGFTVICSMMSAPYCSSSFSRD